MPYLEIRLVCAECRARNWILVNTERPKNPKCDCCGALLMQQRLFSGFLHVLSNPKMPGLLKIGSTTEPLKERAKGLQSVKGVPSPFVVEASFLSEQPDRDEKAVYAALRPNRIIDKEFFESSLDAAIDAVESVLQRPPFFWREETLYAAKRPPLKRRGNGSNGRKKK